MSNLSCTLIYGVLDLHIGDILLHAIHIVASKPSMPANILFVHGCILCNPCCSPHDGHALRRCKTFSLHSGSSRSWLCFRQLLLLAAALAVVFQPTAGNQRPQCIEQRTSHVLAPRGCGGAHTFGSTDASQRTRRTRSSLPLGPRITSASTDHR